MSISIEFHLEYNKEAGGPDMYAVAILTKCVPGAWSEVCERKTELARSDKFTSLYFNCHSLCLHSLAEKLNDPKVYGKINYSIVEAKR
jgi:hypothetical protein